MSLRRLALLGLVGCSAQPGPAAADAPPAIAAKPDPEDSSKPAAVDARAPASGPAAPAAPDPKDSAPKLLLERAIGFAPLADGGLLVEAEYGGPFERLDPAPASGRPGRRRGARPRSAGSSATARPPRRRCA